LPQRGIVTRGKKRGSYAIESVTGYGQHLWGDRGWTRHAHFENSLALLRAGDREIDARCNGVRANKTPCTRHSKGIGDDSDPELRICVFDGSLATAA
jgi:hypothetical protein